MALPRLRTGNFSTQESGRTGKWMNIGRQGEEGSRSFFLLDNKRVSDYIGELNPIQIPGQ
jgi:hypothetical protein